MAKKKMPSASRMTNPTTQAPMVVARTKIDVEVAAEDIARVAFARFVARGGVHGFAMEDWLAAEAELRAKQ